MATVTNLNIRTEKAVKEAVESIFTELGLNMKADNSGKWHTLFLKTEYAK